MEWRDVCGILLSITLSVWVHQVDSNASDKPGRVRATGVHNHIFCPVVMFDKYETWLSRPVFGELSYYPMRSRQHGQLQCSSFENLSPSASFHLGILKDAYILI